MTPINLQLLVPDLKMVFFRGRKAEFEQIELKEELGRGGFAVVFKGMKERRGERREERGERREERKQERGERRGEEKREEGGKSSSIFRGRGGFAVVFKGM
jgi:hypothetical protein